MEVLEFLIKRFGNNVKVDVHRERKITKGISRQVEPDFLPLHTGKASCRDEGMIYRVGGGLVFPHIKLLYEEIPL